MTDAIDYPSEYDNSARVENAAELIDAYIKDAAEFRENDAKNAQYDLAYGPQIRNQLDIFWPDTQMGRARLSPLVMFIHGGYWQRLDRSAFSHMAAGLNANGMAVIIPSYTLCPDITVGGIINEMRRACLMVYQTYQRPLTVIGHSAGGHLAACMMATDWQEINAELPADLVQSGVGISGLYDLIPLTHTTINNALGMNEEQAKSASPLHWTPQTLHHFEAWVGGDESNEYHRQSRSLAQRWSMLGTPTELTLSEGENHFTVIAPLTQKDSPLTKRVVKLVNEPSLNPELETPTEEEMDTALVSIEEMLEAKTPEQENKTRIEEAFEDLTDLPEITPSEYTTHIPSMPDDLDIDAGLEESNKPSKAKELATEKGDNNA